MIYIRTVAQSAFNDTLLGVQSIVISVCMCFRWLIVCLSVLPSAYVSQKPHVLISPNFLYMLLWPWLGPHLTTMQCVMYFRFCG